MQDTHDYQIDRVRLLACFGVVMLHSSYGKGAADLALNAIFRFSVPVFVIISGYFIQLPLRFSNIRNKVPRLFCRMLLCSGVYLLYALMRGGSMPESPILYLLTEPIHLWYLYATMGLYLLSPALAPFVRSAEPKEYRYALLVCFLLGSCIVTLIRLDLFPLVQTILDKSKLPDMLCFTGLYLLGGYFRRFGFSHRRRWFTAGALMTAFSIAASATPYAGQLLSFFSPNVVISGCACFVLCMTLPEVPAQFRRPLSAAAKCTMGVYLFHPMICELITPYLLIPTHIWGGGPAMLLRCICTFVLTLAVIWLLHPIPPLKKWLL